MNLIEQLEKLPQVLAGEGPFYDVCVKLSDVRAIIKQHKSDMGVCLGLQIAPAVILFKEFFGLSKDDGVLIQSWLNSAYEKIAEQHKSESVEPVGVQSSVMRDALMRSVDVVAPTPQPELARCKSCNGNDYDMPCAYPSEGKHGCLRDARLSPQPDHTKLICELVGALESDAYAASFQSMAGYRTALIAKVKGVMG